MKAAGSWLIALALLASAAVRAQDATVADSPYASIIARNMFGLLPMPTNNPDDSKAPADPPPKITPNGIMNIFGRWEALFKVASKGKPGQPAKDDSYTLGEGEMQDDIEVVKINHQDGIITFNNHGTVQELPLVAAKGTGPAPGPAARPGPGNPFLGHPPGMMSPAERAALLRARSMPRGMAPNNPGLPANPGQAMSAQPNYGGASYQPQNNQPANIEDQVMNAAKQMAEIEQNRIATQQAVDAGLMPPLPPTMLTPPDATAAGGSPLVVPSTPAPPPAPGR